MSVTNFIHDPRRPMWQAHSNQVKEMLGIKGKLPPQGMPAQIIQGWSVYVKPLEGEAPSRGKRHTHRVIAVCPECGMHMSAGRTRQHFTRNNLCGM